MFPTASPKTGLSIFPIVRTTLEERCFSAVKHRFKSEVLASRLYFALTRSIRACIGLSPGIRYVHSSV
jgi:hypothetical protein